jgi:UDP:flavonoid glycosyltransferase YjiC (YdhE family)
MRVLCTSTPMDGVVIPLLPIAQALRERGHEVMIAVGPDVQARVEESGFTPTVIGPSAMEAAMRAFGDPAVGGPGVADAVFAAAMFGGVFAPELLPELRRIADGFAPDAVVHPPVEFAAPILATERGIPATTYGFGQVLPADMVAASAERVAPLWEASGLAADPYAGVYLDCYLDPCPPSMRLGGVAPARVVQAIRPEIAGGDSDVLPPEIMALGERPVLYISLGTVPLFNQLTTFNVLLDAIVAEDLDLVVTIGPNNDPAALAELPANVHTYRWLPLRPLLDRCDAVVCHGGSGTTLAALHAGLPLVIVPQGADQFENAIACEKSGTARVLRPDDVESAAIRDAVLAVIATQSSERSAARAVAAEIAAMPAAFDATAVIETLA